MQMNGKGYENYPLWIVIISNCVSFAIYFLGAFIMYRLGAIALIAYLLYIAWLEYRVISSHCVNCYYYGKICAFGKGRISILFFKRGSPEKFNQKQMVWKDMLPDMLVSLVPVVIGIVLMIRHFETIILLAVLFLLLLTTMGNGFVRGTPACRNCKQKELGCPASQLFENK